MDSDVFAQSDKLHVAVLGPFGTYTHEAAYQVFEDSVEYTEQKSITNVFNALTTTVSLGIVPQENTIFGSVIETYDALRASNRVFVRGEVSLKVDHCLLVKSGVRMNEIQTILSHEQALGQCQDFITTHLPQASTEKTHSTAAAARDLLGREPNCAAICSRICATLFQGLEVLHEAIQKESANFTRFYILSQSEDTDLPPTLKLSGHRKALFRIASPYNNEKGECLGIQEVLSALQLDVTRIDRRPSTGSVPFHDLYFIEVQSTPGTDLSEPIEYSWTMEIKKAIDRVLMLGGNIALIGNW